MRWFEKPEVLSYIIESYAGVEGKKRQFIWADANGDVLIGNARAFTDHVSQRFALNLSDKTWTELHEALRALGEVARNYSPRTRHPGKRFRNQQPETRVLHRRR